MTEKASDFSERIGRHPERSEGSGGGGAISSQAGTRHHPRFLAALGMTAAAYHKERTA